MNDLLIRANRFIEENRHQVVTDHRLHFHYMAPIGWVNDPNGLSFFNGKYHLFYQYYPYENIWGPMHWGHAQSEDAVSWETEGVALVPEFDYERDGCFSGSGIEKDGRLYLFYTGNIEGEDQYQNQNLAWTDDGETYIKYEQNPIIPAPPAEGSRDFRDPKVLVLDGIYYMVVGTRKDQDAKLAVYSSQNLLDWQYEGIAFEDRDGTYDMWECPDLFRLADKFVLIASPMKEGKNILPVYYIGDVETDPMQFNSEKVAELDHGTDFYAPQTFQDEKGRRLMIAWMDIWQTSDPLVDDKWRGAMTVTRELSLLNNKVYQMPVTELAEYRYDQESHGETVVTKDHEVLMAVPEACDMVFSIDLSQTSATSFVIGLKSSLDKQERTTLTIDLEKHMVYGSRKDNYQGEKTQFSGPFTTETSLLEFRILIDTNSLEIFINQGETVFTTRVYNQKASQNFSIEVKDDEHLTLKELSFWKMRDCIDQGGQQL